MARDDYSLLGLRDGSLLLLRDGTSGLILDTRFIDTGSSISGGTFSRGRWYKIVEEEEKARQAAREERERERKRKVEAKAKARAEAEAAAEVARKVEHEKILAQLKVSGEQSQALALHLMAAQLAHYPEFKAPQAYPKPTARRPVARRPSTAPVEREAPDRELWHDIPQHTLEAATQLRTQLRKAQRQGTPLSQQQLDAAEKLKKEILGSPRAQRLLGKGKKSERHR
jgi:hypothetical protein